MEVNIHHDNVIDLVLRQRDRFSAAQSISSSSPYVHRDLRNLNNVHMTLPNLCDKIPEVSTLVKLKIFASECYVAHTAVRHRYLLLELGYGKVPVWVRLDRRRSLTSIPSFLLASFKGPANDTVVVSLEKVKLVDKRSTRENRQECDPDQAKTFGEMRHFFALVVRELTHYRLFDANCWLFAGTVQHYLHQQANAKFVSGHFPKSNWASKTRSRVMTAYEDLYYVSTAPLVFKDLHERLDACIRHPLFESDEMWVIPTLRKGIAACEKELATGHQFTMDIYFIRELCNSLRYTYVRNAPSVTESLTEIGVFLAESCRSMSLALPAALAAKGLHMLRSKSSNLELRTLESRLLASFREHRQNLTFVQQYREFCNLEDLGYRFEVTVEIGDSLMFHEDMRLLYLLGTETEKRIIEKSPEFCVSALLKELRQFASFLRLIQRHEEACSIRAQAVHVAQSCQCNSECGYKFGKTSRNLSAIFRDYADSLKEVSRIDESLEQYKASVDAIPRSDPLGCFFHVQQYGDELIQTGRVEESYNVVHEGVENARRKILEAPTQSTAYRLADAIKELCSHPHIETNYDERLRLLSAILHLLRADYGTHIWDEYVASLKREVLWDYANALATLGHYQASKEVFSELVGHWREPYKADWKDDDRPKFVGQWYCAVLNMYAKILDINGENEESHTTRKLAESLQLEHLPPANFCAFQNDRPTWRVHYDEDDPQHPPQLVSFNWKSSKARPAALLPNSLRSADCDVEG